MDNMGDVGVPGAQIYTPAVEMTKIFNFKNVEKKSIVCVFFGVHLSEKL